MEYTKNAINDLFVGLYNSISYIEAKILKEKGVQLSVCEVHLLDSIVKANDNTMSYIAQKLMITQGTLTTNVKSLEKKGYVERYKDDKDKRIVRLRVTDKAYDILKIHDEFHEEMMDQVIGDLESHEEKILIGSLKNVVEHLGDEYSLDFVK